MGNEVMGMKRLLIILLVIVMTMSSLGCQATPEKPVVIGKDTEQLIDAVTKNEDKKTLVEMVNAPDKMELSAQDSKGTVTVNADAEVFVPDATEISTLRVKKHSFTQAEADKTLQYFIGNSDFNNTYSGGYDEQVEALLHWKAELAKSCCALSADNPRLTGVDIDVNRIQFGLG